MDHVGEGGVRPVRKVAMMFSGVAVSVMSIVWVVLLGIVR